MVKTAWAVLGTALLLSACVPPQEPEVLTEIQTDILGDPVFQKIYHFQDQLLTDSIYLYFRHPDPTWRKTAALSIASIRDSSAVDSLALLLNDPIPDVRTAAAYALGQTGAASAESYLIKAFNGYDSLGLYTHTNATILEAIGKCGGKTSLAHLSSVRTYQNGDTLLLLGQARGIYRFGLRGIVSETGTKRMVELSTNPLTPTPARIMASHYLARVPGISLDTFSTQLVRVAREDGDPYIRMALATALGKVKKVAVRDSLLSWYPFETDYRVKVNLLRALGGFDYKVVRPRLFAALSDSNAHIATQAAQLLRDYGSPNDAGTYWKLSRDTLLIPAVKAVLMAAAQRHVPKSRDTLRIKINADNRMRFFAAQKPYNKAAYLRALGEHGWNYRLVYKVWAEATHPAVRSAGVEALSTISARPDFEKYFGIGHKKIAAELSSMFRGVLRSGDAGSMAIAATALRQPERAYIQYLDSLQFLDSALALLKLPRDQETWQEIVQTESFFRTGKTPAPTKPTFNHPIDWNLLKRNRYAAKATLVTDKGTIELELLHRHAPGTTANFIVLAQSKYFDGKNFHRVVPNFVIQGGCPRGDGYGSLDYTIRSELGPMYYDAEGYVGMASAGNHTEGVQFFITHSPTPHLDGNYTIFARVSSGMEVVHQIQPGDVLQKVRIQ